MVDVDQAKMAEFLRAVRSVPTVAAQIAAKIS